MNTHKNSGLHCVGCDLPAGCCESFPNCAGNPEWLTKNLHTLPPQTRLTIAARRITETFFPCSLQVGKTVRHPDGRLVKITGGQYWGSRGLSNHWQWREVMPDGSLSAKLEQGYGW